MQHGLSSAPEKDRLISVLHDLSDDAAHALLIVAKTLAEIEKGIDSEAKKDADRGIDGQ